MLCGFGQGFYCSHIRFQGQTSQEGSSTRLFWKSGRFCLGPMGSSWEWKLTFWTWKWRFERWVSFSNRWFSGSMFNFGGVKDPLQSVGWVLVDNFFWVPKKEDACRSCIFWTDSNDFQWSLQINGRKIAQQNANYYIGMIKWSLRVSRRIQKGLGTTYTHNHKESVGFLGWM